MLQNILSTNFLLLSTLSVGSLNLITPFVKNKDSFLRNFLLLIISTVFLINILLVDILFLKGTSAPINIFNLGDYAITVHLEPIGLVFLNLLGFLWTCALLYTTKYLSINNFTNTSSFLFFLNLTILLGAFIAVSANLLTTFIGYELLTLATIPLINHNPSEIVSTGLRRYLSVLLISSLGLFLPAIVIVYNLAGNDSYIYEGFIHNYLSPKYSVILLLMFIFGISKTAIYPLHNWLPAAMCASYPVSALLHAVVVVKTGLFCIYKVLIYVFGLQYLKYIFGGYNWLLLFPIISIAYSSIKALQTSNIKMILAYSTINQLSIALLSAFMFTPKAMGGAIIHMISHSFTKICLFYAAGTFYSIKKTVEVSDLKGIGWEMPITSTVLLISGLSLMGVPPFAGFISKFYIMVAAAEYNNIVVMLVIVASSVCSSLYMIKIFMAIYDMPEGADYIKLTCIGEKKVPFFIHLSLMLCLSGVVLFFILQQFISEFLWYVR